MRQIDHFLQTPQINALIRGRMTLFTELPRRVIFGSRASGFDASRKLAFIRPHRLIPFRSIPPLTSEEPITPDVHQRIGSVNKPFTISLLLQAEADGLLSLDDTIDQYIKGIPNGDQITLRQMANMTSGIANYTENEQFQEDLVSDA